MLLYMNWDVYTKLTRYCNLQQRYLVLLWYFWLCSLFFAEKTRMWFANDVDLFLNRKTLHSGFNSVMQLYSITWNSEIRSYCIVYSSDVANINFSESDVFILCFLQYWIMSHHRLTFSKSIADYFSWNFSTVLANLFLSVLVVLCGDCTGTLVRVATHGQGSGTGEEQHVQWPEGQELAPWQPVEGEHFRYPFHFN